MVSEDRAYQAQQASFGPHSDDPFWTNWYQRQLGQSTRKDEHAMYARICLLEQECERLRERVAALENR